MVGEIDYITSRIISFIRWIVAGSRCMSKDKIHSSKNTETAGIARERSQTPTNEEAPSNVTKQKVAAAKQYIENHYKKQMKDLQERKERYVYFNLYFGSF